MNKKIVVVTGMFTAGKSTIANNVVRDNDNVYIIPQATIRKKRADDDSNFFRYFDNENDYRNQEFFSCNGNYGILQKDIDNFYKSKYDTAVCVAATPDIPMFVEKIPKENLVLVLRVLGNNLEEEKELINKRFPTYFKEEVLKSRIALGNELAEDYYYNNDFRSNFDLIIPLLDYKKEFLVKDVLISTGLEDSIERGCYDGK